MTEYEGVEVEPRKVKLLVQLYDGGIVDAMVGDDDTLDRWQKHTAHEGSDFETVYAWVAAHPRGGTRGVRAHRRRSR